jgi:hypothetical protein
LIGNSLDCSEGGGVGGGGVGGGVSGAGVGVSGSGVEGGGVGVVDSGLVSGDSSASGVLLLDAGPPLSLLLPNDPGFIHTSCSSFFLNG